MITLDQLKRCLVYINIKNLIFALPLINEALEKYNINTPLRISHFLAQIIHESGSFAYTHEIASGKAYEGRKDLGNINPGDGIKFKGRGYIQLTGRANYKLYGEFLKEDLISFPDLVATKYPTDVAGWYWNTRKLNELADKNDLINITKKINGGLNGLKERQLYLDLAKKVFL